MRGCFMPMFKNESEFSLYIEELKEEKKFDSIIETLVYFYENETDQDMEDIAKLLNRRLREKIAVEASENRLLVDKIREVRLF